MTHNSDRAAVQRPSHDPINLATKRVLARIKASDAVARAIAELAYRPNADAWQRGRV